MKRLKQDFSPEGPEGYTVLLLYKFYINICEKVSVIRCFVLQFVKFLTNNKIIPTLSTIVLKRLGAKPLVLKQDEAI